jgi:glucosamine-6-phosphate deaminase
VQIRIFPDSLWLARAAANDAASIIQHAIEENGRARVVAAAAASQIEFLGLLVRCEGIDWKRVEIFQLDEYVGLPLSHPARFDRFLQEHLIGPTGIYRFHALGESGVPFINEAPVDVAFVGIGENGHLAFNDPPADFGTQEPYIEVQLDRACRQQQVNEGWFAALADVPESAISMSVNQILKARELVAVVPGLRKARAVQSCLQGEIRREAPASALRKHENAVVYLDRDSASLL